MLADLFNPRLLRDLVAFIYMQKEKVRKWKYLVAFYNERYVSKWNRVWNYSYIVVISKCLHHQPISLIVNYFELAKFLVSMDIHFIFMKNFYSQVNLKYTIII